jgi:hypothetical protein
MKRRIIFIPVILAAVVLLAAGLYFHKYHHIKRKYVPPEIAAAHTTYHYQKLDNYKLANDAGSLTFDKPSEFKIYGKPKAGDSQVLMIQLSSNHTVPDVGRIAALILPSPADLTVSKSFGDNLTAADKTQRDQSIKIIRDFVNQRLPFGYTVASFSDFKPFTNQVITGNSWQNDFSAASNKTELPKISGQFITAFGKQSQYFFMDENVQSDWTANQAVWQQVANSLKIDQ